MALFKLAYRNIKGAGLRSWLNVIVLSFSYVVIIWMQGLYTGMLENGARPLIEENIGAGQFWQADYDPLDPLSYEQSHAALPVELRSKVKTGAALPVLIRQGAVYFNGRMQTIVLRGVQPEQSVLKLPTVALNVKLADDIIPILIGKRMAKTLGVNRGDIITVRWRDKKGTFDARDGQIVKIMKTDVATIDQGQIWLPIEKLREMVGLQGEATLVILAPGVEPPVAPPGWEFKTPRYLMRDLIEIVKSKRVSSAILYVLLLFLALIAIFDTQVLSIFRRRKEIGTLIALGLTRLQVVFLFTLEGALYGILAILLAAVYGGPLLFLTAKYGLGMPADATESMGFSIKDNRLFPAYSAGLVIGTVLLIMVTVIIVSYLPSRKIAKMKPTDALKGRLSS